MHDDAPADDDDPMKHLMHSDDPAALYVPAAHVVHTDPAALYVPAAHGSQNADPVVLENPAMHDVHNDPAG